MIMTSNIIQFKLPEQLACPKPTELRNMERDGVRLLVTKESDKIEHTVFSNVDKYYKKETF